MFSQRRSHYWSQQSRTFFFKGFSAKQQKKPKKAANYSVIEQNALSDKHPKMTGQNDWPDESLTGQAHNQAGHGPLTGHYFEPCIWITFWWLSKPVGKSRSCKSPTISCCLQLWRHLEFQKAMQACIFSFCLGIFHPWPWIHHQSDLTERDWKNAVHGLGNLPTPVLHERNWLHSNVSK